MFDVGIVIFATAFDGFETGSCLMNVRRQLVSDPRSRPPGGDYVPLDDPGDSYEWTYVYPEDGYSRALRFIGPGTGDWVVDLFVNGLLVDTIAATSLPDGQRQLIRFWTTASDDLTFRFELVSGAGFGIDAVVI